MIRNTLSRIDKIMRAAKCDALLITSMENIRYISGFTGSSGILLITGGGGIFFTDSRYTEQASREIKADFEVRECKKKNFELAAAIADAGFKAVGFEDSNVTYAVHGELRKELKGVKLAPLKQKLSLLRAVKSSKEIRLISKASDIAFNAFDRVLPLIKPGIREDEIAIELEYLMRKGGAEGISFDVIVASADRSALPHGRASNRRLKVGDPVIIDFGARYEGYHSDETATVFVGMANDRHTTIYKTVKEAHDRAIDHVRPGVRFSEIDQVARDFIGKAGYGKYFGHGTGHGVGLNVHEGPSISPNAKGLVEEGMVFTVEPGIYIPGVGGVRIEDMVVVTKDGCKVLTKISKELTIT